MQRILHILKTTDPLPQKIIQEHAQEAFVEVILLYDAISVVMEGVSVFVLADDANENEAGHCLSYKEMLEKIFEADTVITW